MNDDDLRELALEVLWTWHGKWYTWGGDDPSGIDCSGLIVEVLKSVGLFPRKQDATAEGLRKMYAISTITASKAGPGCLVFWLNSDGDRAVHVEMITAAVGSELYSMGASGGGSHVVDLASAAKANAFVKVRPVSSRAGQKVYIDPFDVPIDDETIQ